MKTFMQIDVLLDLPKAKVEKAHQTLTQAEELAKKYFRAQGFVVLGAVGLARSCTKEEAIIFVPKKVHYGSVYPQCQQRRAKRLTVDWDRVTCKYCLKMRPETQQRSLFDG